MNIVHLYIGYISIAYIYFHFAGEVMEILVEVDNSSSRTVVPKASLHQRWYFRTNISWQVVSAVLAQTRGKKITSHNSEASSVMKLQLLWWKIYI